MRTKRATKLAADEKAQEPLKTAFSEPRMEGEGSAPEPEPLKGETRKAVAWYVNDAGVIQWDRMRDTTKEQLKELLANPATLEQLGMNPKEPSAPVEFFDPEWSDSLYDTLGNVEQLAVIRFWKVNPNLAAKIFVYTEKEKDKLRGPTVRVVNKYAAEWMIRFKDEIALFLMLSAMTANKIAMLKGALQIQEMMEKQAADRARVQAQPPQPPQPQTEPQPEPEPVASPNPNPNGAAVTAA